MGQKEKEIENIKAVLMKKECTINEEEYWLRTSESNLVVTDSNINEKVETHGCYNSTTASLGDNVAPTSAEVRSRRGAACDELNEVEEANEIIEDS